MKVLIIWFLFNVPTSKVQIHKMVMGFESLATCGAVQGAIRRGYKRKGWKEILINGSKITVFYVGCQ